MTALRATLHLGASNVYLLQAGDALAAIDAGPDYEGAWESALAQLEAAGLDAGRVRTVLVTHGHADHCALASRWQREAGARVLIAAGDAAKLGSGGRDPQRVRDLALAFLAESGVSDELLRSAGAAGSRSRSAAAERGSGRLANLRSIAPEHGEWPARLRATPAEADGTIEPGAAVELDGVRLTPLLCPGHTPASTVFLEERNGDLYTGDHVLERIASTPGIQFGERDERLRSLPQYLRSLAAVRDLQPRRVLPGHGAPFTDLAGAVDRVTRTFEQRAVRLLRHLQERPGTTWELMARLYPHLRPGAVWLVLAELTGLLDLLEERGLVALECDRPRLYRATG